MFWLSRMSSKVEEEYVIGTFFKIPKSEIVNQRADNTIVKRNITNRQAMFHITRHDKLKIGQHNPTKCHFIYAYSLVS